MNANAYGTLLRLRRMFFYTAFGWIPLFFVATGMARQTSSTTLPSAVLGWLIVVPLPLGMTFATVIHEPMHRPFGLLLPGARRRFLRWHATVVGLVALICGLLCTWADPSVAWIPAACLAAFVMSLPLPLEPNWRWAGSQTMSWIMGGGIVGLAWYSRDIQEMLSLHPWLGSAIFLALTAANFVVAFSASRRRARATNQVVTALSALDDSALTAEREKERIAQAAPAKRTWKSPMEFTLTTWIRAILYERDSNHRQATGNVFLYLIAGFVFYAFLSGKGEDFAAYLSHLVVPKAGGSIDVALITMMAACRNHWGLHAGRLYPLSRTARAKISLIASLRQTITVFLVTSITLSLIGWVASWLLARPYGPREVFEFMIRMSFMLPLMPLAQWLLLHYDVRRDQAMRSVLFLIAFVPAVFSKAFGAALAAYLASAPGIACLLLVIAGSHAVYYVALRRFYRAGDLLQIGTKRQNFGLV